MTESAKDRKPRLPDEDEPANRAPGDRLDAQGASAAGTPTNSGDSGGRGEGNGDPKPDVPNAPVPDCTEKRDLAGEEPKSFDGQVLDLAEGSLAVIAVLGVLGAGLYVWSGWGGDGDAAGEVFEFVKVGLLPLAVMILTYYFAKQRRAEGGEGSAGGNGGGGSGADGKGNSQPSAGRNDSDA